MTPSGLRAQKNIHQHHKTGSKESEPARWQSIWANRGSWPSSGTSSSCCYWWWGGEGEAVKQSSGFGPKPCVFSAWRIKHGTKKGVLGNPTALSPAPGILIPAFPFLPGDQTGAHQGLATVPHQLSRCHERISKPGQVGQAAQAGQAGGKSLAIALGLGIGLLIYIFWWPYNICYNMPFILVSFFPMDLFLASGRPIQAFGGTYST